MIQSRQEVSTTPGGRPNRLPLHYMLCGTAVIAALVVAAYWPALSGGFVFDDDKLVTDNDLVKVPDGLQRIWTTTEPQDYWPMTNTLFWLEWRVWGMNPIIYHFTCLVLHLVAAFLIWIVLRKIGIPGAFLAALLFAMHPVNVQSVAWISEQKNTLSMVFYLVSILWYVCAEGRRTEGEGREKTVGREWGWYCLSLLAFVLAMLSKGSVAVLPLVLLLIVWWRRGRAGAADLARTSPFFLIAIVFTGVNLWFQTHGSEVVVRNVSFAQRLAGAGDVVWFYLSKALVPIDLMFVYPQWNIRVDEPSSWLPLLAVVLVTAVLLGMREDRNCRAVLFAWLYFCAALLPVLGFTDVGFMKFSLVADHYQHIAIIGVMALVAAGWTVWHDRTEGLVRCAATVIAVAAVCIFSFLSWNQSQTYADAITLYRSTMDKNPDCWMAHNNLGKRLLELGQTHVAQSHFEEALRLKSDYPDAHNNLGNALLKTGHLQEAMEHYQQALRLKSDYPEPYANLALTYAQLRRPDDAIAAAQKALELARAQGRTSMAQRLETWLLSYRAGQNLPERVPAR